METKLFYLAGITNILAASTVLLTRNPVSQIHPEVFSTFGLVGIILWGLAYIVVANHHQRVNALVFVFFLEKMAYVASWILWWTNHHAEFRSIFDESFQAGIVLVIYGIIDLVFGIFFAWVFLTGRNSNRDSQTEPG